MKKVFIVHGFGGIPNGGWISWIMAELAKDKIYACALPMPESKSPIVSNWLDEIDHVLKNSPDDEIILVGHSLGATAVLKYLEANEQNNHISSCILVSGLISPLDPQNKDSVYRAIDSFVSTPINFEKIKGKSKKFTVIHSVDDPAVPFHHAEQIVDSLGCEFVKLEKGGHFFILSEPICYKFPELLEIILKEVKKSTVN